jgi:hypothetical protein
MIGILDKNFTIWKSGLLEKMLSELSQVKTQLLRFIGNWISLERVDR